MSTAAKVKNISSPRIPFDAAKIREDFPILKQKVGEKPLVYLDNAATSQKPLSVIEAVNRYYREENANIHRGVHMLSEKATDLYESARKKIQKFIGAAHSHEIVFTRGTTESINLVAASWGRSHLKKDDEILITHMEHHSNIVPWQLIAEQTGAKLKVAPINDAGEILWPDFEELLNEKTKMVAVVHVSNSLGTVNPVNRIIAAAHRRNIPVLLDGAQAVPHFPVDVQGLDADFYAFSGHKLFGPTGIGVLYGKEKFLDAIPPYQGGGDMIRTVSFEGTTFNHLPFKFEAGTQHIAGAIGLGAAVDYLNALDFKSVVLYEEALLEYTRKKLGSVEGLKAVGTAADHASVFSFVMEGIHPHDIGTILDDEGIAIRTGHHCTMPLMKRLGIPATARASMTFYNTMEEIDLLARALQKVREVFA